MDIVDSAARCSWCSAQLTGVEGKGLCADCEDELRLHQCVACDHSAEFVCVRCGDTVCLLHRQGLLHEPCLCRRCSPRAVRLRPWRELGEFGVALAGLSMVLWASLGLGIIVRVGVLAVGVAALGLLRVRQNRARLALLTDVAKTPRLAAARLFSWSGARPRQRRFPRARG